MARRMPLGLGGLWLRLALAFLLVSVIAVAVETAVGSASLSRDATAVARQQQVVLGHAVALTTGAAYQGVGWAHADLHPVFDLAARAGAAVRVRAEAGRVVGSSPGYANYPIAGEMTLPIVAVVRMLNNVPVRVRQGIARLAIVRQAVARQAIDRPTTVRIGQITIRFNGGDLSALAKRFESRRIRSRILAAAIAALIALAVSVGAARLTIAPIESVLNAMRARAGGDRDYRISKLRAPGVLRRLLEGFNETSDAFDAMERAQRDLVADVAHEVRTPVAILQGETEALVDGVSEATQENLDSLHAEVMRLARMVDGLQRLAAADSAELQLKRHNHDLAEIAAEVVGRLRDSFAFAGVTLSTKLAPAVALCDRDRIQDVISNLLTNALKFTPPGGRVTVESGRDDDHQAFVLVSDTGVGIPAADLPHVTERFFRGREQSGMVQGSGIGMAIVAELIHAHHGHLSLSSEEGRGTQVAFTLPRADD